MNKRWNVINNVLVIVIVLGLALAVMLVGRDSFQNLGLLLVYFLVGAIISGFVNALIHELGHLVFGLGNGFKLSAIFVWFFRLSREDGKTVFSFGLPAQEAGYTEMIPTNVKDMKKGCRRMTFGGIFFSFLFFLISIVPLFFVSKLSSFVYGIFGMNLVVSGYYFFGNFLPMMAEGARNDGLTLLRLIRYDDSAKVLAGVLTIQQELSLGKTPAEIDKGLYFELPQLPEDDMYFAMILELRFYYYLDMGDIENANKTLSRLIAIYESMPNGVQVAIDLHTLYGACTINYNEDTADDKMYELEKFVNKVNNAQNVRVKLCYMLYVQKVDDLELLNMFYEKGIRESKKCPLKGIGEMERKLFEKIKADFPKEDVKKIEVDEETDKVEVEEKE